MVKKYRKNQGNHKGLPLLHADGKQPVCRIICFFLVGEIEFSQALLKGLLFCLRHFLKNRLNNVGICGIITHHLIYYWKLTMTQDELKQKVAQAALHYIKDVSIIGVGTGSTVNHFIDFLADFRARY